VAAFHGCIGATVVKNCSSSFDAGFTHIFLLQNIIVQHIQSMNYKIIENYFLAAHI